MNSELLAKLEHNIISNEKDILLCKIFWPAGAIEAYEQELNEGCPVAFSMCAGRRYVIGTSGQGPYIIWQEYA